MLSEINQSPKDKYCVRYHLHEVPKAVKLIEKKKQDDGSQGLGWRQWVDVY